MLGRDRWSTVCCSERLTHWQTNQCRAETFGALWMFFSWIKLRFYVAIVFGFIELRTGTVQNHSLLGLSGYLFVQITKHLKRGQFLSYQDMWSAYLWWLTIWVTRHRCDVSDCDLGGLCSVEIQHKSLRSAAVTPPPALCRARCVIWSFWPFILSLSTIFIPCSLL